MRIPVSAAAHIAAFMIASLTSCDLIADDFLSDTNRPLYLLLEPVGKETPGGLQIMRPIPTADPRMPAIRDILSKPFLMWVLEIGSKARANAENRCTKTDVAVRCASQWNRPAYIVIKEGGNRPRYGLAILRNDITEERPNSWYIEVDFEYGADLIAHEYGHVILFESLPEDVPAHPRQLPHVTGAITNDITAFSEGWGIHFETLAAEQVENADLIESQHRSRFVLDGDFELGDSLVAPRDLLTLSQGYRRYGCVKENCFAFLPRVRAKVLMGPGPELEDLLWAWTDTTYDPARVRTLEQMVASEGLVAALFYRLGTAPRGRDDGLPPASRYAAFLEVFTELTEDRLNSTPAVLLFLEKLLERSPDSERRRIARVALEVMHLTPVLNNAPALFRALHESGHRIDIHEGRRRVEGVAKEIEDGVMKLVANPQLLSNAAGPEIWLRHPILLFDLPILDIENLPLVFDLNTATLEFILTIPGIELNEAMAIVSFREQHGGFAELESIANVPGVKNSTVDAALAMHISDLLE